MDRPFGFGKLDLKRPDNRGSIPRGAISFKIESFISKYVLCTYMEQQFVHKVSKGSRFNQIYVPKEYEKDFEVGDIVEVRLVEKKNKIYYSRNLKKLPEFKEKIITDIFNFLSNNKKIEQIIVFGSFLTKDIDYSDIDVLVFSETESEDEVYRELIKNLKLKFHVLSVRKEVFMRTLEICPITRSMVYYFVSNKMFDIPNKYAINQNHLRFLLMMPEDLLKVKLNEGKVYYNSLRKLVTIENFLNGNETDPAKIDEELYKVIEKRKIDALRNNWKIEGNFLKEIERIIKSKLKIIYNLLQNGEK